jgi:hypothetical protein
MLLLFWRRAWRPGQRQASTVKSSAPPKRAASDGVACCVAVDHAPLLLAEAGPQAGRQAGRQLAPLITLRAVARHWDVGRALWLLAPSSSINECLGPSLQEDAGWGAHRGMRGCTAVLLLLLSLVTETCLPIRIQHWCIVWTADAYCRGLWIRWDVIAALGVGGYVIECIGLH